MKDHFLFQKIPPSCEHRAEISGAMEGLGINYWKHSGAAFKEMWGTCPGPQRELGAETSLCPPAFNRLQLTPRVWIFGTNCFVQLEHQIISSYSMKVMKACQIYSVDLESSAEASLKGDHHPVQNSVNVMIIPNPVQDWSASCTRERTQCSVFTKSCLPLIFKLMHSSSNLSCLGNGILATSW